MDFVDAVKHHKTMIELIDNLSSIEFDPLTGAEPLTTKARDNAIHLLARRGDLAIGMSFKLTSIGGITLDFIRNEREYVVDIDDQGRSSLVAGNGPTPCGFGMSHSSVNQVFLSKLEHEIPDPLKGESGPDYELIPLAGTVLDRLFGSDDILDVQAHGSRYIGMRVKNAKHGFDTACFPVLGDMDLNADTVRDMVHAGVEKGQPIHLGRRIPQHDLISLHAIGSCPEELLKDSSLPCGWKLDGIRNEVMRNRQAV